MYIGLPEMLRPQEGIRGECGYKKSKEARKL